MSSTAVAESDKHGVIKLRATDEAGAAAPLFSRLKASGIRDWIMSVLPECNLKNVIAALYEDEDALYVRMYMGDVAFVMELRDLMLTNEIGERLTANLPLFEAKLRGETGEKADRPSGPGLSISADTTQFALSYEECILSMDQLTEHQAQKLRELTSQRAPYVHLKAAAGAGKTFVGLHRMLQLLLEDADATVLFVAMNRALCSFVARWLCRRIRNTLQRHRFLGRLRLLFEPLSDGPRAIKLERGQLSFAPAPSSAKPAFSLVMVDEAHHIYDSKTQREQLEAHVPAGAHLLLLSDVSQSLSPDVLYPPGDAKVVEMTEVVRSTQRIVRGAAAFQLGENKLETASQHNAQGPPLKSFLFERGGASLRACYAEQVLDALSFVASRFPGLDLHDRIALITPTVEFAQELRHELEAGLARRFAANGFRLVSAAQASSVISRSEGESWLVLDSVGAFDGLERLIVLAVGLDSPIEAGDLAGRRSARSMLYRALTRAQMLAMVVNEFHPDGWLAFLTQLEMQRNALFNLEAEKAQYRPEAVEEVVADGWQRQAEGSPAAPAEAPPAAQERAPQPVPEEPAPQPAGAQAPPAPEGGPAPGPTPEPKFMQTIWDSSGNKVAAAAGRVNFNPFQAENLMKPVSLLVDWEAAPKTVPAGMPIRVDGPRESHDEFVWIAEPVPPGTANFSVEFDLVMSLEKVGSGAGEMYRQGGVGFGSDRPCGHQSPGDLNWPSARTKGRAIWFSFGPLTTVYGFSQRGDVALEPRQLRVQAYDLKLPEPTGGAFQLGVGETTSRWKIEVVGRRVVVFINGAKWYDFEAGKEPTGYIGFWRARSAYIVEAYQFKINM